jgi:uncharacterized protein (TIGR00266 family)
MEAAPAAAHTPQAAMVPSQASAGGTPHEITHGPSFAMLRVDLPPGQEVVAEAGSMVARNSQVEMEVKLNAGSASGFFAKFKAFIIAMIRKIVGGETFFVNHFSSPSGGSVWIAPTMSGQITHRRMSGETLTLSSGAFLASVGNFDVKMKFGGLRSLLAKEGAFFLQLVGNGDLWFNSYGGVHAIPVNGAYMVDNGHLVGFEGNLSFDIKAAGGGLMGFMASGEGLVCQFQGQGTVYIQSRNTSALVNWLTGFLRG